MRIVMWNHRGGVGKTTLATHTAGLIAAAGSPVVLANLDPQANSIDRLRIPLASHTGAGGWDGGGSYADALLDRGALPRLVADSRRTNLTVASVGPATIERLRDQRLSADDLEQRHRQLLQRIAADTGGYVIVDCPPSVTPASMAALAAADGIVVPVATPGHDTLNALGDLVTAATDRHAVGRIVAVVPMFWPTRALHRRRHDAWRTRLATLFDHHGIDLPVWDGFIRALPRLGIELEDSGLLVHELAATATGNRQAAARLIDTANDLTALIEWILHTTATLTTAAGR